MAQAPAARQPARPAARPAAPARPAPKAEPQEEVEGNGAAVPEMPMTVTGSIPAESKGPGAGTSASVSYDFGSSVDEAIDKFGEDVVFGIYLDQAVIRLQAIIRRHLADKDGFDQKKLDAAVAAWKPKVGGGVRKSAVEKANDLLDKMTDQQRAELLAKLTGKAAPAPRSAARR